MRTHLMPLASVVLTIPEMVIGARSERGPDPMPRRAELTISKRTVDGLSVEARDAVFWDRELPGFVMYDLDTNDLIDNLYVFISPVSETQANSIKLQRSRRISDVALPPDPREDLYLFGETFNYPHLGGL